MIQLEIDYFWPLTEQIPLDLDFNGCYNGSIVTTASPLITLGGTTSVPAWISVSPSNLTIDVDTTTIATKSKPPIIRRLLYKLLGIEWKIK